MFFKRIFLFFLILVWIVGCVNVISTSVGYTPFRIKASIKINAFQMIPQGWGFFTRNPREDNLIVYQIINDSLQKITRPNFSSDNLYGLSRTGRMNQMQIGTLVLPYYSQWQKCDRKEISECISDTVLTVENAFQHSLLKGRYLIQKRTTIPWAWSSSRKDQVHSYEILAIDVQ